ncbi:MAG: helix-turn-helix transcriptional regulator [Acidimicrobiales bacterium]|nr:helix-turn-helix transcriptional regulator [Acidimicrobiales bacterium]
MSSHAPSAANRRELIVDAALRRMTSLGYEGTTIGDIAKDLDISKAAVVYYFRRKDDFLTEFIAPVLEQLEQAVDAAETVQEAVAGYLSVLIDNRERAKWIDTDPIIQSHPEYGARLSEVNGRLMGAITGGSRTSADRVRALAVLGGLWRPTRELPAEVLDKQREEVVRAAMASY